MVFTRRDVPFELYGIDMLHNEFMVAMFVQIYLLETTVNRRKCAAL